MVIDDIVNHIKDFWFELVSPSIPRSQFQRLKRSFYIFILTNVSEKLFYFLRDKVSPIKFLDKRLGGEIWLRKRFKDEVGHLCEIEMRPIPPEAAIYVDDIKGIFKPQYSDNYKVSVYYPYGRIRFNREISSNTNGPPSNSIVFPINCVTGIKSIDSYFSDLPELNSLLRDYKLKKLLK